MGSTQKSEVAGCCAAIIDSSRRAERIQPTRVNLATKHHGPRFLHHPNSPALQTLHARSLAISQHT